MKTWANPLIYGCLVTLVVCHSKRLANLKSIINKVEGEQKKSDFFF